MKTIKIVLAMFVAFFAAPLLFYVVEVSGNILTSPNHFTIVNRVIFGAIIIPSNLAIANSLINYKMKILNNQWILPIISWSSILMVLHMVFSRYGGLKVFFRGETSFDVIIMSVAILIATNIYIFWYFVFNKILCMFKKSRVEKHFDFSMWSERPQNERVEHKGKSVSEKLKIVLYIAPIFAILPLLIYVLREQGIFYSSMSRMIFSFFVAPLILAIATNVIGSKKSFMEHKLAISATALISLVCTGHFIFIRPSLVGASQFEPLMLGVMYLFSINSYVFLSFIIKKIKRRINESTKQ